MGQGSPLVALVRGQLKSAHDVLEGTMQGVTPELAHWQPPGLAHSIAATYAHVLVAEDAILNGLTREEMTPLMAADWASKTGLSSLPPMGGDWAEWATTMTADLVLPPSNRPSGPGNAKAATTSPHSWLITITGLSTCRWPTASGSLTPGSGPRSARSGRRTTTRWPSPSTACTRPR